MALGSTQPLREMSTRNLPGGKGRPARGADNPTAICEPFVYKMWEPRRLTALWAFTACYRDSFTFAFLLYHEDIWVSGGIAPPLHVIKLRAPLKAGNLLSSWMTVSFSRRILRRGGGRCAPVCLVSCSRPRGIQRVNTAVWCLTQ
jgi:hypothetical protein